MHPGDTIKPRSEPPKTDEEDKSEKHNTAADSAQEQNPWQYSPETEHIPDAPAQSAINPVQWTASEFIEHEKNSSWFVVLAAATGVAVVIIYLITHDLITSFVIIIAAAIFGVAAKRKPRTLQYEVDNRGIRIGSKFYGYDIFKSFSILAEGAFSSIQLTPLKRFMPIITLYYPLENEEQILDVLGSYLPHEDRTHDPIDKLMRKVRF